MPPAGDLRPGEARLGSARRGVARSCERGECGMQARSAFDGPRESVLVARCVVDTQVSRGRCDNATMLRTL
jgi:hypothetical protein